MENKMAIKKPDIKFTVIRDTREQKGKGWTFEPNEYCDGMKIKGLPTADYTIEGFEDKIVIERKATTGEISQNIFEARFENELKRLEEFDHPYMIFEFDYNDIKIFPVNSTLPKYLWHKLKMTKDIMEKTIARYQIQYKTKIIFAGKHGQDIATMIFKQFLKYGNKDDSK